MPAYGIKLNEQNNPILEELVTVPVKNKIEAEKTLEDAISKLKRLYRRIPDICCEKCGKCCTRIGYPIVYSTEYLNIMRFLNYTDNKDIKIRLFASVMKIKTSLDMRDKKKSTGKKRVSYKTNWCPAFDHESRLCSIYEQRPLDCRLYGLRRWFKDEQGWVDQAQYTQCEHIQISKNDRTKHWDFAIE